MSSTDERLADSKHSTNELFLWVEVVLLLKIFLEVLGNFLLN